VGGDTAIAGLRGFGIQFRTALAGLRGFDTHFHTAIAGLRVQRVKFNSRKINVAQFSLSEETINTNNPNITKHKTTGVHWAVKDDTIAP